MKYVIVLASLLVTVNLAHAKSSKVACGFGESTADLDDSFELKTGAPGKIWYKGESLSVENKARLGGLTPLERQMILMAVNRENNMTDDEVLESFSSDAGYLTYFFHNSNGREFVMVGAYPGDNEFGVILELKKSRKSEPKILGVAAVISDGDLEDCKVTKDEVKE